MLEQHLIQYYCTKSHENCPVAWNFAANIILRKFLNQQIFLYLDDILCHTKDFNTHVKLLDQIFKKLNKHHIKLKIEKFTFFASETNYLGFKFTKNGLAVDERKTKCINEFPIPNDIKSLQRFLGLCSFLRRFIPHYSTIASSLYALLKKDAKYEWTSITQRAFDLLKEKLFTPPVLAYPNIEDGIFSLICDASQVAAGSILMIRENNQDRPVSYFSRIFNDTQRRYHSNDLECLSVVWSVEHYRIYLYGREKFFINNVVKFHLDPGHKKSRIHRWRWALQEYNFEIVHKKGSNNLAADSLSRIDVNSNKIDDSEIIFVMQTRSKTQKEATQCSTSTPDTTTDRLPPDKLYFIEEKNNLLISNREHDHIFYFLERKNCKLHKQLQHKLKKKICLDALQSIELYKIDNNRSIVILAKSISTPDELEIAQRTLNLIKKFASNFGFENLAFCIEFNDSTSYFNFKHTILKLFQGSTIKVTLFLCKVIELTDPTDINKVLEFYNYSLLGGHANFARTYNLIRRFFTWHDMRSNIKKFINDCQNCQRNKYSNKPKQPMLISSTATKAMEVISFDHCGRINPPTPRSNQCTFLKFCFTFPVKDVTADTTARIMVEQIFSLFGFPKAMISDSHPSFTGSLFKQINKLLKIKHIFTSPFHPAPDETEASMKKIGNYLRAFGEENPHDWDLRLPYFMFNHNSLVHASTGYSPFQLMFARNIEYPNILSSNSLKTYSYEDFYDELRIKMFNTWKWAHANIIKKKEYNQKYCNNRNKVAETDIKAGDNVYIKNHLKSHKFSNLYSGLYLVDKVTGQNSVIVKKGNKTVRVHKDNLKLSSIQKIDTLTSSMRRYSL